MKIAKKKLNSERGNSTKGARRSVQANFDFDDANYIYNVYNIYMHVFIFFFYNSFIRLSQNHIQTHFDRFTVPVNAICNISSNKRFRFSY